jgi:uncharacterized membrane protein
MEAMAVSLFQPESAGRQSLSSHAVNALIHLHRAEVGRLTAYRARLDTTTNWAITTSALVTTFALSSDERTHAALVFLMILVYFFLHLEARRFSAYEGARWTSRLIAALRDPVYPTVPLLLAISWRLRRVYLWIYGGILLAWLSKLHLAEWPSLDLLARASIGFLPGWVVLLAVAALYVWLVAVAAWPGRRHPLGDPYALEVVGQRQP